MPSIPLPAMQRRLTQVVHDYRVYTRDHAALNRLVRGEESSDRDIQWAVLDFIDHFNSMGHLTNYGLHNYPAQGRSVLLRGVVLTMLEGVVLLGMRNYSTFSDGGLNFSTESRVPLLMQYVGQLRDTVDQRILRLKAAINIEEAMGGEGVRSEYSLVNTNYFLTALR